ncbi:MAG TPA: hypothetical protein DHV48_03660 [Prolixibacteraceae bacterium]|nr:hypothetical protein [Prolixibacteraceae bacterium]
MGITPRFSQQQEVLRETRKGLQTIERGIIRILQYAGEKFVTDAREALKISGDWEQRILTAKEIEKGRTQPKWGDYLDQTGNLRSSIGYFVLNDGKIVMDEFSGTAEGIAAGRQALEFVKVKSGYQLVGVAGMDYASYVESKGYNVISAQSVVAIEGIEPSLLKFKDRLNKKGVDAGFDVGDIGYGFISSELK